ncbi:MAG: hypothetical protein ACEQSU_04750 [Microgenomates group bacterium]
MFQVAVNSGLTVESYGPFDPESADRLTEAMVLFEKGQRLAPLELNPVVLKPKHKPACVFFSNRLLLLHKDKAMEAGLKLFLSEIMAEARIGDWGDYFLFHCPSIENVFVDQLDFSRSLFELVSRSTMALSPSAPWEVMEYIRDTSSLAQLKARKTHPILDVLVVSNAQMSTPWSRDFFVFDGRIYVSTDLLKIAPELVVTEAKCNLIDTAA